MLITDRQESVALNSVQTGYSFSHQGKDHKLSSLDEVHEFFRKNTDLDSVKFTCDGQKHYAHFFDKEVEVYPTKKALRRTLSLEGRGAWIEEKGGKKRYFVEEKGWLSTSYKEVEAKDCVEPISTWQKVLGLGLGMLAIAPGVSEFLRHVPITKEAAMGALALQQKSPLGGLFALSMMPSEVFAQSSNTTEFRVNTNIVDFQGYPSLAPLQNGGFVVTWVSSVQDGNADGIFAQIFDSSSFPEGSEFQVNNYTTGTQEHPAVATFDDGSLVVVWSSNGQDGDTQGVFGQRFDSTGVPIGLEFQVNTVTANAQEFPSVTSLSDGGFVVVWESFGQDAQARGVFGQKFDRNGSPVGLEFQVNTFEDSEQKLAKVTRLSSGGFVVVYDSINLDGDITGVAGQRFDNNATKLGTEFLINTYTTSQQRRPSVGASPNGRFLVAWESVGQDVVSTAGIYGQLYLDDGLSLGSEFQVNNYTLDAQIYPSVGALANGDFVIVWASNLQDGNSYGIFGQRVDGNASPIGSEFQINTATDGAQDYPEVVGLSDGGFLVTWQSLGEGQDGSSAGIYAKRFDASGAVVAPPPTEFRVNTYTNSEQTQPDVTSLSNGNYVIVWQGEVQDGDQGGIFAQIYDRNGPPLSPEFQINSYTTNHQGAPSIASLQNGEFVVTWTSTGQDGDQYGVYAQRLDSNGTFLGSEFLVNTYTTSFQAAPSVTRLDGGGFVITWTSTGQDGSSDGVYAQIYGSNGSPVGGEFRANTYTATGQSMSIVIPVQDGGFLVVWQSHDQVAPGSGTDIFAQRYTSTGQTVASEILINSNTVSIQREVSGTRLVDGSIVIAWQSMNQDGDVDGIIGRKYTADVNPAALGEFLINTYTTSDQQRPSIAPLNNGGFVVAWQSLDQDGDQHGIYAQRFDANATVVGAEFQVHTTTAGQQLNPEVAALSDGGFIITWQSDHQGWDIYAKRFDASGLPMPYSENFPMTTTAFPPSSTTSFTTTPATTPSIPVETEYHVTNSTAYEQTLPDIATLTNGNFVIVWSSREDQDGDSDGVFGHLYAQSGASIGGEFQVNNYTTSIQTRPSVTKLQNGEYVVVWQSSQQDGDSEGVFGQRFAANGTTLGAEFPANSYTTNSQSEPRVACLEDGGFIITWDSNGQDGDTKGIFGQRFAANGNPVGNEFQVNTNTVSTQEFSSPVGMADGGFVITWMSLDIDGLGFGISGQRYDVLSSPVGSEFQINSYTINAQTRPSATHLVNGDFVVTWQSIQDGDLYGIYSQRFDSNATSIGSEFLVNTYTTNNQAFPNVAALQGGGFVIAWESLGQDGDLEGIYAQRYDGNGTRIDSEFQVHSTTTGAQRRPRVTGLLDGGFVVTWFSVDQSEMDIYAKRFDANGLPISFEIISPTMTSTPTSSSSSIPSPTPTPTAPVTSTNPSSPLSSPSSTLTAPVTSMNPPGPSPSSSSDSPVEESEVPSGGGFPAWAGAVIGGGITACLGILGLFGYKKHKGKKEEEDPEKNPAKVTDPPPVRLEGFESTKSASTSPETSSSSSSEDQVDLGPHPLDELVQIIDGKTFVGPNQEYELLSTIDRATGKDIRKKTGFRVNFHGKKIGSGEIGAGAYGSVSIARTKSGEYVALKKVVGGPNNTEIQEAIDEAKIHYHLRDIPNIIPFYHAFLSDDDQVIYLASSLAGYGTGKDLSINLQTLDDQEQKERIVIDAAKGLSRAVAGMHAKRIFHLDLKWDNVVFDKNGEAYVIDLGKAQVLPSGILEKPKDAMPEFLPPEIYMQYRNREHKAAEAGKIDAWGLGTCLLNFVIGKNFFDKKGILNHGGKHFFYRGSDEEFAKDLHAEMNRAEMPQELRTVIIGLLKIDPKERLSAQRAMKVLGKLESYADNREGKKQREADFKMMKPVLV